METTRVKRGVAAAAIVAAISTGLSGCGDPPSSPPPSATFAYDPDEVDPSPQKGKGVKPGRRPEAKRL